MSYQQALKLSEPCVSAFDDPEALIPTQFTSIFVTSLLVVAPVGHNQFNPTLLQLFPQWIAVVGPVRNQSFRLLSRPAFGFGDADFGERGFRKRSFSRIGIFQPNSQRKTPTVDQYHRIRSLAALGFNDCRAPFSQVQCCRPESSLPIAIGLCRLKSQAALDRRQARRPPLPIASGVASRLPEKDTCLAETATLLRSSAPTRFLQGKHGSMPRGDRYCHCAASVPATTARLRTTGHPSTTQNAS